MAPLPTTGAGPSANASGPIVYDTFTDTNGVSLDAHTPDIIPSGGWTEQAGGWDIQSNRAHPTASTSIATLQAGISDAICDLVSNSGHGSLSYGTGIVARFTDTNNYWSCFIVNKTNEIDLTEHTSGGDTQRASAALVIADSTDFDLRVVADGQTIDMYVDGANKISYASASSNETATIWGFRSRVVQQTHDDLSIYTL